MPPVVLPAEPPTAMQNTIIEQRAARNNRGHLIDANGLKTRRRKRRDNSKHRAAEKHRKAVVDIGGA